MIKERTKLIIRLVSTHLVLIPAVLLVSLLLNHNTILLLSINQTLIFILFLAGYWEFFGLRFRIFYSASLEILLFALCIYKQHSTGSNDCLFNSNAILMLFEAYLLFELVRIFLVIIPRKNKCIDINFPFKHGKYLITDGGNSKLSRLMNYHYYSAVHKKNKTNNSMLFATDIVKVQKGGNSFFPPNNEDYPVFGEKVYCPLSGIVVKVVNNVNDNIPYSGGYPYNTGNSIVIRKDSLYLLMGHLKKESIVVAEGDMVNINQFLAKAGNSGFTERPHIHIQLIESKTENYWQGFGVEIRYDKRNLYKNRIIDID